MKVVQQIVIQKRRQGVIVYFTRVSMYGMLLWDPDIKAAKKFLNGEDAKTFIKNWKLKDCMIIPIV